MMVVRSIKFKIGFWAGLCLVATSGLVVAFAGLSMKRSAATARQEAVAQAQERTLGAAKETSAVVRADIEVALDAARTLAQALCSAKQTGQAGEVDWPRIERRYGSNLQHTVNLAVSLVRPYIDAAAKGEIPLPEAQKLASERVQAMRYDGGTGYLWINDMTEPKPRMIMHPTLPALNGKILDDAKFDCAMGKKQNLFQAMVEACKARKEGFVNYIWPKPAKDGLTTPEPKLSYVQLIPEWNWVVGTGVYVQDATLTVTRDDVNSILKSVLNENPRFVGTYTCWEPNAFDGKDDQFKGKPGHDETGRFIPYWNRDKDGRMACEALKDYEKPGDGDYYVLPRKTKNECIIDPYVYPVQGKDTLLTSLVVPIVVNGTFYGIAGVDLRLDDLQKRTDEAAKPLYGGTAKLQVVSNNGTFAAASGQAALAGKPMKDLYKNWQNDLARIREGKAAVAVADGNTQAIAPLQSGKTTTPWR